MRAGRYVLQAVIGRGGNATVHLGKLSAPGDFQRVVAIKRLHPELAGDDAALESFVDEAKVASRIRSIHVVPTLDVVAENHELFLVMDYVDGESLARLISGAAKNERRIPPSIALAIVADVLRGLGAAHQATAPDGSPLGIVHRDVSPQNVLVGIDGIARLLDFGIAKAEGRLQITRTGIVKGKVGYMSPEQLRGEPLDARTDIYAAGVVAWEALVGERLFRGEGEDVVNRVLAGRIDPPSTRVSGVPPMIDDVILRALAPRADDRFASAGEMLAALEAVMAPASASEVADYVRREAAEALAERARLVAECEAAVIDPTPEPGLAAPAGGPVRARRGRRVVLGGALAVALIAAVLAVVGSRRPPSTPAESEEATQSVVPPTATGPATDPTELNEPNESPRAAESAPSSAPARPRPRVPRNTVQSPPQARARCSPPYEIDADGHKRWKRECFQ